jgi:hypothetical protein
MLGLLEEIRIHVAGRPLLLWIIALGVMSLWRRGRRKGLHSSSATPWWVGTITGFAAIAYIAIAVWYATVPYFFDNAEPTIPSVAWAYEHGFPLYHSLDSADRYAHIYGPFAFLTHAWALSAAGPGIRVSKAVGVGAALATVVILFLVTWSRHRWRRALSIVGGAALVFLLFRNYTFWTRPDPLQILSVMVSLALAGRDRPSVASSLLAGAAAGFGWDLRFTGPLYTLVPLALIGRRQGWAMAAAAALVGLCVAAAPFARGAAVSWTHYVGWIQASGQTGLLLATLRQNIEWALFLTAPLLLASFASCASHENADSEWRVLVGCLLIGVCGVVIAASKPGAGPYHLLPFVPVIGWLVARHADVLTSRPDRLRPLAAWIGVALVIAIVQQAQFLTAVRARARVGDVDELAALSRTYPGVLEMGYGSDESLSLERPILVFRNGSYFLDQPAVREYQLQGMELPAATISALRDCRAAYWLTPRHEHPFSAVNAYSLVALQPLYSETFRSTFFRTHRLVGSSPHFDVWQCLGTGR